MVELVDAIAALPDKSLLVLDDDGPLRNRLGRALETRGFEVRQAESVKEAIAAVRENPPAYAVLDLRLEDGTGLSVVETIREARPDARVVMLGEGRFGGNPMAAHARHPITPQMFDRWLALWGETTGELFGPELAADFQARAARIAESLKIGLFFRAADAAPS